MDLGISSGCLGADDKRGKGKAKDKHAAQPIAERGLTCCADKLGGGHGVKRPPIA